MAHLDRVRIAFALTVVLVGICTVLEMFFSIGLASSVFSLPFLGISLGLGYIFAPMVVRFIKYK